MKRHWAAAVFLIASGVIAPTLAQDYPARTITMIVPFAVGGPADITGRIVADIFSRRLGKSVVVENINGAGGTIGALRAARATPDGYTILFGHMSTNALAPAFYPDLKYDPQKDFEPIGLAAEYPELLVVRKDLPAKSLREFVAYAKANADKLNVGHAGVGSISYIGCLLLNSAIGIKPTLVPFTGTAPVLNAMLAGEIDYECDPVLGTLPQVQAGSVRALAIAARQRSPMLPDVPTSDEQGLGEFDIAVKYAVFAPAGTPKPVVEKLAAALNEGLDEEPVKKRLAELGATLIEPGRRGPKPLADLVRSEAARLIPILQAATSK
ncbi:Bug family tripartite tricarboxylate transporter substrate binding protein [Bradyrhizobium sp.]|uniref:Bug family tripartite tricarboxylate transporter substrate binding protein n=1 Tax=Bradyrhizobium sp. TaxID=376 RepID=UPI002D52FF87|nr:tripartite tricarboxylate transporter substrate-binding protein [Bradyrhizobium sp.]HZR72059.1 tripartite tricarboxylate transporter substrate-binding protein [Bradyrhizobium sp.]